jgi:hypothetical protein
MTDLFLLTLQQNNGIVFILNSLVGGIISLSSSILTAMDAGLESIVKEQVRGEKERLIGAL